MRWYLLLSVTISKPEVGGKMAHVRQKDEGGVRKKNNDKPRGVKADKQVTTAAVA